MAALEEIARGSAVRGILPDGIVTISDVRWIGTVAIEVTYKDSAGRLGNELLYRDREPTLEIAEIGQPWSFDGDAALFRLLSEANRIRLAYLFDPLLAVHTSLVDPLPHQITAVYAEMLSRQPLRFLLADDPGAGLAAQALAISSVTSTFFSAVTRARTFPVLTWMTGEPPLSGPMALSKSSRWGLMPMTFPGLPRSTSVCRPMSGMITWSPGSTLAAASAGRGR